VPSSITSSPRPRVKPLHGPICLIRRSRVRRHSSWLGRDRDRGEQTFLGERAGAHRENVSEAETRKNRRPSDSPIGSSVFWYRRLAAGPVVAAVAWVVDGRAIRTSSIRAMAVLVAAARARLAIATPSAVLSGMPGAARRGVSDQGWRSTRKASDRLMRSRLTDGTLHRRTTQRITDVSPATRH